MNFLEICKRVRSEVGETGDGPVTVLNQTGMSLKIVEWVKSAHQEIQLRSAKWKFDWATTSQSLVAGQESYDPVSDWTLSPRNWDWDSVYVYQTTPSERTWLTRLDYNTFIQTRLPAVQGRPIYVAWAPDKTLKFYPIPTSGLTFVGDFYRKPEVLAANTDEPRIPEEYHMAIVWRAVMMWCASEENQMLYGVASQNFNSIMRKMEITELDGPFEPETLA